MGFTLGKYLTEHGNKVTGYVSRNTHSAREAAQFTDSKVYEDPGALVRDSDVLFLTVPDSCITSVYEEIAAYPIRGKYICHCSGSMTSGEAFPGIDETGAYEYSVHPLFAVSDPYTAYLELSDVFFTIEGNRDHLADMMQMLQDAGLTVQPLDPAQKTRYHTAAAMASNLMIGLLSESMEQLMQCGFSQEDARRALGPLVRGNVNHFLSDGPEDALTGPVERGDSQTIRKHLRTLGNSDAGAVYRLLSSELVEIAKRKHRSRDYTGILEELKK